MKKTNKTQLGIIGSGGFAREVLQLALDIQKNKEVWFKEIYFVELDKYFTTDSVDKIKKGCEADATRIAGEKALCEEDLAKAQPFVDQANDAIKRYETC